MTTRFQRRRTGGLCHRRAADWWFNDFAKARRMIFPVVVRGRSSTKCTCRGTSWAASRVLTCALELADQLVARLVAVSQNDERSGDLAADLVWHAHHRAHRHGGMTHERCLDLPGADAIAHRVDHVVLATPEPQVSVVVLDSEISGEQPAVVVLVRSGLGTVPVLEHHHRIGGSHGDLALDAHDRFDVGVQYPHVMAGHGPAHRSGADRKERRTVPHHEVGFGLPVALVDLTPEVLPDPGQHRVAQRFTAREDGP